MRKRIKRGRANRTDDSAPALLIATRKGAFVLSGDCSRRKWSLSDPIFLGHVIHHIKFINSEQARDLDAQLNERDEISILLALSGGSGSGGVS